MVVGGEEDSEIIIGHREGNEGMGEEEEAASGSVAKEAFSAGLELRLLEWWLGCCNCELCGYFTACGSWWRLVEACGGF